MIFVLWQGRVALRPESRLLDFPRDGFCSLTRKAGLFAQGVYANGTRLEQKALLDAVSGQKTRAGKRRARQKTLAARPSIMRWRRGADLP